MARLLYALGQRAASHRGKVLLAWGIVLALAIGLGGALHGELSSVFTVPGTQSQNAQNLLQQRFPAAAGGTARIVFAAPAGTTLVSAEREAAIAASLLGASRVPGVIAVTSPFKAGAVSASKTIGYADVLFRRPGPDVTQAARDRLDTAMNPARAVGLQVAFGGTAFAAKSELGGAGEVIGIVVAFVVLAVALSSLLAAGLPLLTALGGVAIGVLVVEFLARFIQLTSTATVLATMIGLAVGIDYALFIVSRHREQLTAPEQGIADSIGRAIGTAGSSVVFAGSTVIIALAALSAAGIPFLTVMGLAAAGTVALAVLIAITLVPALLSLAGERLRPRPASRRAGRPQPTAGSTGQDGGYRARQGRWGLAWARLVGRAPAAVLAVCIAGLVVLALPISHLRLGLPGNNSQPASSTQHQSYDLLARGFGPGFNATLAAVVDASHIPASGRAALVASLSADIRRDSGVARSSSSAGCRRAMAAAATHRPLSRPACGAAAGSSAPPR